MAGLRSTRSAGQGVRSGDSHSGTGGPVGSAASAVGGSRDAQRRVVDVDALHLHDGNVGAGVLDLPGFWLNITAAVLFHGGQNVLAVLNDGFDPLRGGWVMVGVYGLAALLIVIMTKGRLGMPPAEHQMSDPVTSRPVRLPERGKA